MSWEAIDLDLTAATLTDFDLSGCTARMAIFSLAVFAGPADFSSATFTGPVSFRSATFAAAHFEEATFADRVDFSEATFTGTVDFAAVTFEPGVPREAERFRAVGRGGRIR